MKGLESYLTTKAVHCESGSMISKFDSAGSSSSWSDRTLIDYNQCFLFLPKKKTRLSLRDCIDYYGDKLEWPIAT